MPFPDRLGRRSAFVAMRGSQILPLGLKLSCALRAEIFERLSFSGLKVTKSWLGLGKKLPYSWCLMCGDPR